MIVTGREPTLPTHLFSDASPSPATENTSEYVETIQQRLQLTYQEMATPPAMPIANRYQVGNLIFALTTPPERTSKLAPQWNGLYRVCCISNEYQVVYEDDGLERTIHVNHAIPAKFTAPDLPEPVPSTEVPRPPLSYLPSGLARRPPKPRAPPENPSVAPAPPAAPAEHNMTSPAAAPANQHPEPAPPRRQSPRLNPEQGQAHAILSLPAARPPHSAKPIQDGPHLPSHH